MTTGRKAKGCKITWRVLLAALALACASGAGAQAAPVDLAIVDRETGRDLTAWRHDGRLFVAGQPGDRYSLRVSNHTGGRVLLVLSVDGVNVVTGETAGYDQRGYVLNAYEAYDVTGWRKSNAEVAAFTFAALPQSYAARTGRPGDVGVIGMAVFDERPAPATVAEPAPSRWERNRSRPAASGADLPPPPLYIPPVMAPAPRSAAPGIAPAARESAEFDALPRRDKLGTAHGAREASWANETTFTRATRYPRDTRQVEYDSYANLAARGVAPAYPTPHQPRAFPSELRPDGFVPDPPADR